MSWALTSTPTSGTSHSHGGSLTSRASFTYGKLETIANASSATPASCTRPETGRSTRTARASTAAAIVVGTPQKNRPSFGETLNRASRIAEQAATRPQATPAAVCETCPASDA